MAFCNNLSLPPLPDVAENWGISQSKLYKINYTWTIHNFSFLSNEWLKSPAFFSDNDNLKWCLDLYPNNLQNDKIFYTALYLRLLSASDKSKVICKFSLSILNAKCQKLNERKIDDVGVFTEGTCKGFYNFIQRKTLIQKLNGFMQEDVLTVFCEIDVVTNKVNVSGRKGTVQIEFTECNLSNDFAHLLDSQKLSDVKLVVGEQEFPAHKAILGARSDVFAAMFEHEMEEKKSGQVIITDVKPEVLQEMLNFIYTGDSPKIEQMAHELFVAADKYSLKKLKNMCEKVLLVGLTNETAAETLILADRHDGDLLKNETINFIKNHAKDILQTKGWGKMFESNPALIKETLEALFIPKMEQLPISE